MAGSRAPSLFRLELEPAQQFSPEDTDRTTRLPAMGLSSRVANDPRALASVLRPEHDVATPAATSSAPRRLRQRSRSGVDIGDIPQKAGSPRRIGSRSTSVSNLNGSSPVSSVDSQHADLSPGSARARHARRRRIRTRSDTELDNSNATLSARIVTLWRSERTTEHLCCDAPGLMIHPHTPFCQAKDLLFMLLVIYSSSWEPFVAAFEEQDEFASGFSLFVDLCYWVDILTNFFTGYEKTSGVELDQRAVALNYLTGWFCIDFIATFPWDIVLGEIADQEEQQAKPMQYTALIRLMRLIRILRILRLGRIVERLSTFFRMRSAFIKITKLIFQLLLVVHLLACFFYLTSFLSSTDPIVGPEMEALPQTHPQYVNATMLLNRANACYSDSDYATYGSMVNTWVCEAGLGPGNADAARKYVTAAYWAITTMSTIGYGDITPSTANNTEMLFTALVEFLGLFVFSYTVSNMAELVGNLNAKSRDFHVLLDRHLEYMRDKDIPLELQDRVLEYLGYQQASRLAKTAEDEAIFAALSPSLQMELLQSIYVPVLQAVPLFSDPDLTEFVEDLAMCLKVMTVLHDDLIISRGERGHDCFFIILAGSVKVFGHSEEGAHEIFAADDFPFFGVAEMLVNESSDQLEHRSVVATAMCDLARIHREDWEKVTARFPKMRIGMAAIAQAELADVRQLDSEMAQAELQVKFEARLAAQAHTGVSCEDRGGASNGESIHHQRLKKEQLRLLVEELDAELSDLDLHAAMVAMDVDSVGGVSFDQFLLWWTSKTRSTATVRGISEQSAAGRTSLIATERDKALKSRFRMATAEGALTSSAGRTQTQSGEAETTADVCGLEARVLAMNSRLSKLEATALKTQCGVDDLRNDVGQRMVDLDNKLDRLSRSVTDSVGLIVAELRTLRGEHVEPGPSTTASMGASNTAMSYSRADEQERVKASKMAGRLSTLSATAAPINADLEQSREPIVPSTRDEDAESEDTDGAADGLRP